MIGLPRRALLSSGLAAGLSSPALIRAQPSAIRIGEINSYTAAPSFTLPYRNGWQLGVEQANANGGVLGRPIEVIARDDAGNPTDAVRLAGELINDHKVDLLAGGYLSNVGLAISDFALHTKTLFIASEPLTDALVWDKGHRYCYRLRPSTYMQAAMLVQDAAKLSAKRWATVAPNYEYGMSAVKWFKQLLTEQRPDVEFVAAQWPAMGKIDAAATVSAIAQSQPDAILNVTFGPDLTNFVRQGNTRGLFEGRSAASFTTGEPEYLEPLGEETPAGWIVTGYPVDSVSDPGNLTFIDAYRARFKQMPKMGSAVGYTLISAIIAGIQKSGSVETEAMATGFGGADFATPFGPAHWRALDHQSTLGTYVGRLAVKQGKGIMVDWRYVDGADALPPDDQVRAMRRA
jgi:branched-chain amino acid transport system substrate-binding protein